MSNILNVILGIAGIIGGWCILAPILEFHMHYDFNMPYDETDEDCVDDDE